MGFPVVKRKVFKEWLICYYEEFEQILITEDCPHDEIQQLLTFSQALGLAKGFRREIVIASFPFLCAVRPEEKTIYIGTRRLSRELSLLKIHESESTSLEEESEKKLFTLKEHIEKISSLSPANFPSEIEWVTYKNNLPNFLKKDEWKEVDEQSKVLLKKLVKEVKDYKSSLFEKISDYGLTLTAQYDLIRVHLLKFLALLPSLDHDKNGTEVKRNLIESLRRLKADSDLLSQKKKRGVRSLPLYLLITFSFVNFFANLLPAPILAACVRYAVRAMAKRFIAGESISTSDKTLRDLRLSQRNATLDQLGELVVSAREADEYFEKVIHLIHGLKHHIPKGEKNAAGIFSAHVSIKVSALSHEFKPQAFESTFAKVAPRLRRILQEAKREDVFINIDAEHYHYRDVVLKIYSKVLLETVELKDFDQTGIVIQAYLRDGAIHLKDVIALAQSRNLRMPIRLVKGAYWDAETIEGEAHQFTAPQFLNKEESDLHFRQLAFETLKNSDWLQLAIASHNLQDHVFVESLRNIKFPKAPVIEHQCLHMTYEALSRGLARMGWPTRNYMPIGNLLVGMAYLVRRIMENSSQVGVLSIMRSHQKASGLISPVEIHLQKKGEASLVQDSFISQLKSDFFPIRPLRLFLDSERVFLEDEIKSFNAFVKLHQVDWKNSSFRKVFSSSEPDLIIGHVQDAKLQDSLLAVDSAENGLKKSWWGKSHSTLERASVLLRAADLMLERRCRLAALMVFEAGKTMSEALADVDEAIDFINFYVRQEIQIQLSGQKVINRGVFAVIAPWNFPLAIPCGMAAAPLIAGNAVILKPAEQTPLIGQELYNLFIEAGVPKDIFYLIHGDGENVAAPLVDHARVAGIVFTGSKQVGQLIYRNSASKSITHYETDQLLQKKVITEMGGKNAIIVTNNCEMDETISGILYSAFGHAGQKCSAASRILVHKEVKESLVIRLKEAVKDLKVGSSVDPATSVNPLISEFDQSRVRNIVEEAKDEVIRHHGKIIIDRSFEKNAGFCVGPVVLDIPSHQARKKESWAQREIFGPVIHVIEYESLMEAIELFNSTDYALTGGIYSQSQDDIDFLLKFLRAGNLYVNRPNTGARVAIEPFGGFKLSGTGPKAGGVDYLLQFHASLASQVTQKNSDIEFAQGPHYQMFLPRPSLISIPGRLSRFNLFADAFLNQYEVFMGHINEKEKSDLVYLVSWIKEHLSGYLTSKHMNLVIPGQLSYNDKSIVKEAGLFVVLSPYPSIKSIFYLFGALSLGSGISVACVSRESFMSWKPLIELAWKSGFAKSNLDLTLVSPDDLKVYFDNPGYSYVYADGLNSHSDLFNMLFQGNALNESMRQVLSENDGNILLSPSNVLDLFVWCRSMAINTMRHGAPLEIHS